MEKIYYYFKYTDILEKGNLKVIICEGKELEIEIKTNGDLLIAPASYYNNNLGNEIKYSWVNSIHDTDIAEFPNWILKNIKDRDLTKEEKQKKREKICMMRI